MANMRISRTDYTIVGEIAVAHEMKNFSVTIAIWLDEWMGYQYAFTYPANYHFLPKLGFEIGRNFGEYMEFSSSDAAFAAALEKLHEVVTIQEMEYGKHIGLTK